MNQVLFVCGPHITMDYGAIRFVRRERICIYSFFCSIKVITKWKNSYVISSSYMRYEDC